ncbi:MAG: radical SAM protein [Pseudomonadota bacterium]
MTKMRVALIWPKGFDPKYVMPLALGYLKSNLSNENYDVRIFDNSLRNIGADSQEFADELRNFDPHVVGVSCWSPTFREGLRIVQLSKSLNPDVITVAGGSHIASYADKVMSHKEFDFIFRGESELSFPVFLDQLRRPDPDWALVRGLVYRGASGELVRNEMERRDDLDVIRIPDYDAMNLQGYYQIGYRWNTPVKHNAPVWVTRGCPYRCTFCAAPELNGKPVRKHGIPYMLDWIRYLYHENGVRWINIIDDNFTYDKRYAKAFCQAVIGLQLKDLGFGTPNGIRMSKGDPELWKLMKQAGWRTLIVAPESGSEHTLKIMQKDLKIEIVPRVVHEIREAGLKVQAFFILGYPGERKEDLEKTAALIQECRFNFVFMNNFQPLPGTPVYDDLVAHGEIPDGLLPTNYSDGSRAYTPPELKDFNFPRFILKTYLLMCLRDPLNVPYMITLFDPLMLAKKLFLNTANMLLSRHKAASSGSAPTAPAPHP